MIHEPYPSDRLEKAVADLPPDELQKLYGEMGKVEFSTRALGLACRFRGLETVKALSRCGATFYISQDAITERRYRIYSGTKYENYRSDFSLYLLRTFKKIPGACCCVGLRFQKYLPASGKKKHEMISDEERAKVLGYLCDNAEKLYFKPSELLFFSIFTRDEFIYKELKKRGVTLSEKRVSIMTGGGIMSDMYWFEFLSLIKKLSDEDFLPVMRLLYSELGGGKFYCTNKVYELCKARFGLPGVGELFCECFNTDKLNKLELLRGMVEENAVNMLELAEKAGWLANNKRRDDLIAFARQGGQTECLAWLLDFKNRTADFAAENERAEKRRMAELNAAPNSVLVMKKLWSFKKIDDELMKRNLFRVIDGLSGTLAITSYKGGMTDVTVPEKIGKSEVRAVSNGAFAGASGVGAGNVRPIASAEQMKWRMDNIRSVTLPDTIKYIGVGAFAMLRMCKTINIPDGVEEIDNFAFTRCYELEEIVIPGSVKRIGMYAFSNCARLTRVVIREGAETIGAGAFSECMRLETVELPASLREFGEENTWGGRVNVFGKSNTGRLAVKCPKGSRAEEYCKSLGIKTVN